MRVVSFGVYKQWPVNIFKVLWEGASFDLSSLLRDFATIMLYTALFAMN